MGIINITLHGEGYELRSKTRLVNNPDGTTSENIDVEVCPIKSATGGDAEDTSRRQNCFDDCPVIE